MGLAQRALAALTLAAVVLSCVAPLPGAPAQIEQQFELLERLGLDLYWDANDCRLIAYERGIFRHAEDDPQSCWVIGFDDAIPMDDQAAADLVSVREAFAGADVPMEYIRIDRDWQGSVGPGSWFVQDGCFTYSYEGDRDVVLEDGSLETVSPLGDGWWLISSC